jgi:hypothetical protein
MKVIFIQLANKARHVAVFKVLRENRSSEFLALDARIVSISHIRAAGWVDGL